MKPSVDKFLQVAVVHLLTRTSPALPTYEQSNVMVLSGMLTAVQQEFERAAARRVEENDAIRRLFVDAAPLVKENSGLAVRLSEAGNSGNSSLVISDLERENGNLRSLLIELHSYVEGLESSEARHVEDAIWAELVASTERRRLMIGRF